MPWLLLALAGAANAQPVCPPTSPDPVVQTVQVGEAPAPLRIQLDVISTVPPPPNFFFFLITSNAGQFVSGGIKAGIPVQPALVDAATNRWRYSGEIAVAPLNAAGVITIEGDAPLCILQPLGPVGPGTVAYTINVVDQPPPPPPADPQIRFLGGSGDLVEIGRTLDLNVQVENPPAGQSVSGYPLEFTISAGNAVFDTNGGTILATTAAGDGTAVARIRAGTQAGRVLVEARPAAGAPFPATPAAREINVVRPPARTFVLVSGNGQSGAAGTAGAALVAGLSEFSGFPATGVAVEWRTVEGPTVLLDQPSGTTASNGRIQTGIRFAQQPGTSIVEARAFTGETIRYTVTTTLAQGARALNVTGGADQSGAVNSDADQPIVFTLTENGQAVVGEAVSFRVAEGTASLAATSANTDSSGRASVSFRYGGSAGRIRIEATAGSLVASALASAFQPDLRIVSGNGQSGRAGTRLPQDLVLEIAQPVPGDLGKGLTGVPVTWTVVSGGGTLGSASNTTDARGRAANQLTLGTTAGENRIRATLPGIGSVDFVATATLPPVNRIAIASGDGQTGALNSDADQPIVFVLTEDNAPVAGEALVLRVAEGAATLLTPSATTDAQGRASVRFRYGASAGRVRIEASARGTTAIATATAFAPNLRIVAGNNQSARVGTRLPQDLVLEISQSTPTDLEKGLAGVPVTWTVVSGGGTLGSASNTTDARGRAANQLTLGTTAGENRIRATLPGIGSVDFVATATPPPVIRIAVASGDGQTGALNSDADQPIVFVLTQDDVPIVGEALAFRVVEGSATLATTSATTDAEGRARVGFRFGNTSGRIRIESSARGASAVASATAFAPNLRIVAGNNQSARVGTRLPQDLVLEISQSTPTDLEKGLGGVPVTWTVVSGGGTLANASNTTDARGRAANQLTLGTTAGENRIRATLPGIGSVDFVATATLPPVNRIAIASGDGQTGALNSDADQPIVFVLTEDNAPVAGEALVLRVAEGAATLLTPSATTDAQGRASVRFRYGASAGRVRIEASARGTTALATATAFAPNLRIASGNVQSGRIATRLAQDLVLEIAQPALAAGAKGLAGVPVSWTIVSGGGTLTASSGITDAQGRASNQLTLGPTAGENRVRATLPGIGTLDFVATAVDPVPAGSVFEIVSGNGQSLPTASPSAPLVVRLRTSGGAPVVGTPVAFSVSPAGAATLSNTTTTTGNNGLAQTVAVLGLPGTVRITASLPDAGAGGPTVVFTLNGGVANIAGLDPITNSVAGAIDVACPALFQQSQQGALPPGASDLLARCSELVGNAGARPDAVNSALRQMSSEESDAQNTASIGAARAQYDNLASRVSALRAGSAGISIDGLALAGGNGALPLSFLPTTQLMQSDSQDEQEVGADFSRWGFFATGTIGQGELDDRGDSPGFDFDTYGLTAGVDYRFSDTFVAGVAVGYSDTDTDVNGDSGELATRGLSLSGYGTWYRGESFYVDGVATIGRNSYELSRRVLYTLGGTRVDQNALADPDGDQRSFAVSIGRDVNRGALNISPYLRAAWARIEFDPYTERMSNPSAAGGGLALAVEGRTLRSFEGVLGAKASYTMSRDWGILIPHATIEVLREFEDEPNTVVSRFVNDPTRTPILVQGIAPDRDYFNLGLGLSGVFAGGRSAFIYLENRAGQRDYTQTTLAAGVRIEF